VIKVNTCYSYILFWLPKNCIHNQLCIFVDITFQLVVIGVYEAITRYGSKLKLLMIHVGK
jgi:hypothetical protein